MTSNLFFFDSAEEECPRVVSDPPAEKNEGEKAGSGSSSPASPRSKGRRRNGASMLTASLPPSNLFESSLSPRSTLLAAPSSAPILTATLEEQGEEGMDTNIDVPLSQGRGACRDKKPRIPPFFVSPKG
ncbi:hypothetical protein TNCV_1194421 [Trichonephila clavipes]|nr:hypothetical protein TNCV_1194421 [Trichonephila clavipes]